MRIERMRNRRPVMRPVVDPKTIAYYEKMAAMSVKSFALPGKVASNIKADTPVAICREIFNKGFDLDPNYKRRTFLADCLEAGVKKSTSGKMWLPLGGERDERYRKEESWKEINWKK
jgi:hypothetical protein